MLLTSVLAAGCNRTEPEPVAQSVAPQVAPAAQGTSPAPSAGQNPHGAQNAPAGSHGSGADVVDPATPPVEIVWDVPTDWKMLPARMMRHATYEATGKAGAAEIAVFYFGPGQGGDVEANIARWLGQFQNLPAGAEKRTVDEVNGFKRFNVRVEQGTFASGMPGAAAESKSDWGMLATIVQTPSGQYFFKMTGPAATVTEQQENFARLLASARPKK